MRLCDDLQLVIHELTADPGLSLRLLIYRHIFQYAQLARRPEGVQSRPQCRRQVTLAQVGCAFHDHLLLFVFHPYPGLTVIARGKKASNRLPVDSRLPEVHRQDAGAPPGITEDVQQQWQELFHVDRTRHCATLESEIGCSFVIVDTTFLMGSCIHGPAPLSRHGFTHNLISSNILRINHVLRHLPRDQPENVRSPAIGENQK